MCVLLPGAVQEEQADASLTSCHFFVYPFDTSSWDKLFYLHHNTIICRFLSQTHTYTHLKAELYILVPEMCLFEFTVQFSGSLNVIWNTGWISSWLSVLNLMSLFKICHYSKLPVWIAYSGEVGCWTYKMLNQSVLRINGVTIAWWCHEHDVEIEKRLFAKPFSPCPWFIERINESSVSRHFAFSSEEKGAFY